MKVITNKKNKKRFTDILAELVCEKKIDLQNSLYLIGHNKNLKNKAVTLAANNIYSALLNGVSFSNALKLCQFIEFDLLYISFICFAERAGCLEKTLLFLRDKCNREQENISKIAEASVYPVFVIILAVAACCFLFPYSKNLLVMNPETGQSDQVLYSSIGLAFCFLGVFCLISFILLHRLLGTNKLYEAFLAMGFLIKGGESLANAVKDAVIILGYDSKEGRLFARAGENLSYGISLKDSFKSWNNSLHSELEEAFFYAENSGGENDVFEKIASWINSRDEKRRAICFKLVEPFFISGTGLFLLVFLVNLVLPLMTQSMNFL